MTRKQMSLFVNMQPSGVHPGAWRSPEVNERAFIDLSYYREIARLAEAGRIDALFLADFAALQAESSRMPRWTLDPLVTLSALAAVSEHVGLVASISTTLSQPYHVARVIASLDHASNGRAGWNVVTSFDQNAARNFGLAELPEKEARYRRAGEFVDVVKELWASWEEGALALNPETGVFIDTDKVHAIDHQGEFFSVAGPLQVPTPPQGQPVVFQAGGSDAGRDLAATQADGVFAALLGFDSSRAYREDLRLRAEKAGRNPDEIKLFPGAVVVVGRTRDEALAKRQALQDRVGTDTERLIGLAHMLGVAPEVLKLDEPLADEVREAPTTAGYGAEGFRQAILGFFDDPQRTVRDFLRDGSLGHRSVFGNPQQIADDFEEWFEGGAADGFMLMFDAIPTGLRDFIELVIPELQRRGLFRREYEEAQLGARLGLPRHRSAERGER